MRTLLQALLSTAALCWLPMTALAQQEAPGGEADTAEAVTIADAVIPVGVLDLLLTPLPRDQLAVEAAAWRNLVEAKASEVSNAEIAIANKTSELKSIDEAKQAATEIGQASADGEAPQADKLEAAREILKGSIESVEQTGKPNESASPPADTAEAQALRGMVARLGEADEPAAGGTKAETSVTTVEGMPTDQQSAERIVQQMERVASAKSKVKEHLLEYTTLVRDERTALLDRLEVVLAAWESKGGDPDQISEYRLYASAVSGIRVDVSDTEAAFATILGWLLSDEGGKRWALNIGKFLAILLAFQVLAVILRHAAERALRLSGSVSVLLRKVVVSTISRATQIVGLIVAASALEINVGPLLAVIGATGFVIAFALQSTLSNIASGIMIMLMRPFDEGDAIEVSGISGSVRAMSLVSTTITTFDNKVMIVPNNSIWGNIITNIGGSDQRRVDMTFGIGYEDDIHRAREVLAEIVGAHPDVLAEPEPVIQLHELGDSSVNFICRPWAKTEDYWTVYWDVTLAVKERFDAEGISIPYPQRDVHIYQQAVAPTAAAAAGEQPSELDAKSRLEPPEPDDEDSQSDG